MIRELAGSLCWAFMIQAGSILLGDLTRRPVWVLTGVTRSLWSKAAVRMALVTHVGLVGCFPSPMGDPQSGGKVWVDPEERLVGLGSCDFLTRGRIWAGEHESLCRACVVQEGVVLAGWLMRGLVWA